MKMTPAESAILGWFRDRMSQPISVEEIADFIYLGKARPKFWRAIILRLMRDVCFKSAHISDLVVYRKTGLGRAKKAIFTARKSLTRSNKS